MTVRGGLTLYIYLGIDLSGERMVVSSNFIKNN